MEISSRPHYHNQQDEISIIREDHHHLAAAAAAAAKAADKVAASSSSSNHHQLFTTQFHHQQQIESPTFRSDPNNNNNNNPYPTTFVTADTSSFKQVVQMLTGSPDSQHHYPPPHSPSSNNNHPDSQHHYYPPLHSPSSNNNHPDSQHHHYPPPHSPSSNNSKNFVIPPIRTAHNKKQQHPSGFKLYERRNTLLKSRLTINPHNNHESSSFTAQFDILSPSTLNFPSLTLSPVTTLEGATPGEDQCDEEVRAIAEKGFYFLPSPTSASPQLLPLFPLTSPRFHNNDQRHQKEEQPMTAQSSTTSATC